MIGRAITPADAEWPGCLSEFARARPLRRLYVIGAPVAVEPYAVAVVGSRRPTATGLEVAYDIARGLAEASLPVVSGLAIGIDAAAHQAALDAGGYTIGVLGCGLDVEYPKRNARLKRRIASSGTLITEYDDGVPPQPDHFPARNRIIAGLAQAVVFVEGSERSGGLITARLALDGNRHVFAVPGSVRNPMAKGPNELIRTGQAGLATCVQHVLEEVAPGLVWREAGESERAFGQPMVNPSEAAILLFLDDAPTSLDRLCSGLGLSFGEVAIALAALEVRNLVAKRRGGYVATEAGARLRHVIPVDELDDVGSGALTLPAPT